MQKNHSFSIANTINPITGQPFGEKYGGTFSIRRPSIQDKRNIELMDAARRNAYGRVDADQMPGGLEQAAYIHIYVSGIATEELPKWFNLATMYDEEDECALSVVWQEVQAFVNSFRAKQPGGSGAEGGGEPGVLVSEGVRAGAD